MHQSTNRLDLQVLAPLGGATGESATPTRPQWKCHNMLEGDFLSFPLNPHIPRSPVDKIHTHNYNKTMHPHDDLIKRIPRNRKREWGWFSCPNVPLNHT